MSVIPISKCSDSIQPFDNLEPFLHALDQRHLELEQARRMPEDMSKSLAQSGLYRLLVPEHYGGLEVAPSVYYALIEKIAYTNASVAWCTMISATSGLLLAFLADKTAKEIFSDPSIALCGVTAPMGRAIFAKDHYRVNGRWSWGSNCHNADWIIAGTKAYHGDQLQTLANGQANSHLMFIPRHKVDILDTWYPCGLAGSGSHDFEITDIDVAQDHCVTLFSAKPTVERPLYVFPTFGLLALGICAVAMGTARRSLDEFMYLAQGKTPAMSQRTLAQRPTIQAQVADAEACWQSARSWLMDTVEQAWSHAQTHATLSIALRNNMRLSTTHATHQAAHCVDVMYHAAGGSAIHQSSALQRCFRDVHVATQHIMVSPTIKELTGRLLLGLETDTTML